MCELKIFRHLAKFLLDFKEKKCQERKCVIEKIGKVEF